MYTTTYSMPIPDEFKLDYGTKPSASDLQEVKVEIHPEVMLRDFAKAYSAELHRRNPLRAEQANLTEDELDYYFTGILIYRIQHIYDNCKVWRQIKQLNIPSWIQFTISLIGRVIDYDYGLMIMPSLEGDVDLNRMLEISTRLESFRTDGVTMHKDAFPRVKEGDKDTMTMCLIDGYVKSMSKDAHPIYSYVTGFLGLKLVEDATFKILYRVRYDDINFIRQMLISEGKLI